MNMRDVIPVCPHGSKGLLDLYLVSFVGWLDESVYERLTISSGYRCPVCNKAAGGAENSSHTRGKAIDIVPFSAEQRFEILGLAFLKGIKRIGIAEDHIHLDVDESLPQGVVWIE